MTKEEITKNYDYNESVSYKKVIESYNALIADGKKSDANMLLGEHGGMIALYVKYLFQNKEL